MFKENTFYRAVHRVNLTQDGGPYLEIGDIILITSVSMLSEDSQKVSLIFDYKKLEVAWDLEYCSWLSEIE